MCKRVSCQGILIIVECPVSFPQLVITGGDDLDFWVVYDVSPSHWIMSADGSGDETIAT